MSDLPGRILNPTFSDALWLLTRRLRGQRITAPSCRRCGYPVTGLTKPQCPECGADLYADGIIDPAITWRSSRWIIPALVIWSLTVFIAASSLQSWIDKRVLRRYYPTQFSGAELLGPNGIQVTIVAKTKPFFHWPWSSPHQPVVTFDTLLRPPDGSLSSSRLRYDFRTAVCSAIWTSGMYSIDEQTDRIFSRYFDSRPLTDATIENWLRNDTYLTQIPTANTAAMAQDIHALIQATIGSTITNFEPRLAAASKKSTTLQYLGPGQFFPVTGQLSPHGDLIRALFWWTLWAVGLLLFFRPRLRRKKPQPPLAA